VSSGGAGIEGISSLAAELFVVRSLQSKVEVWDTHNFTLARHVTVPDMEYPQSLVACLHYNCLYISDYRPHCIHRVDLSNSSVTKWSVDGEPFGLSVTRNHHLLVALYSSKRIREYTTHGSVTREINLDVSIDYPWHAIELSSGQFVVCHGNVLLRQQPRVCIVDTSGLIIQSYGGPRGSSTGQLSYPLCLAVDKRGCVLVADYFNHKIQILSPTLTHLGDVTLPSEHELRYPQRLHLDELNGRLYVGEGIGRLFVLAASDPTMK
jgi:hypothetical protein